MTTLKINMNIKTYWVFFTLLHLALLSSKLTSYYDAVKEQVVLQNFQVILAHGAMLRMFYLYIRILINTENAQHRVEFLVFPISNNITLKF